MRTTSVLASLLALCAHRIVEAKFTLEIRNRCNQTICPGYTGTDLLTKEFRGFGPSPCLKYNQFYSVGIKPVWAGRVWPRTGCNENITRCLVGDCGSSDCTGKSSSNTTLVEMTVNTTEVHYDISIGKFAFVPFVKSACSPADNGTLTLQSMVIPIPSLSKCWAWG